MAVTAQWPTPLNGDELRQRRRSLGASQYDLAGVLGVGRESVRRWEREAEKLELGGLAGVGTFCRCGGLLLPEDQECPRCGKKLAT